MDPYHWLDLVGERTRLPIFYDLAFMETIPMMALASAILTQWFVKSAYEAAVTPLTYIVVSFLKRREGVEIFDHDTRFNPVLFGQ